MKRLVAIFFIFVLAFNLAGYRLLLSWLQEKQSVALTQRINTGINEGELISVKVPAALPYYTNANDFQWVDGEVMIEGVLYQYVQRRIWNDSIEFRCLKNEGKTRLQSARDGFFSLAYSLQTSKEKSNNTAQVKPLLLEYCAFGKVPFNNTQVLKSAKVFIPGKEFLCNLYAAASPEQPPEAI